MKTITSLPVWKRITVGGMTRGQIIRKLHELNMKRGSIVPIANITVDTDLDNLPPSIVFSSWATRLMMMDEFVVSPSEEVNFAVVTPADIGVMGKNNNSNLICDSDLNSLYDESKLQDRLLNHGLEFCKPDDGPHIRLVYLDQPYGNWKAVFNVGMKKIEYIGRNIFMLRATEDGTLRLDVPNFDGHPACMWSFMEQKYIFRSKKA